MTTISAQTILRSRHASAPDKVLSTLLLRYPRFIHSELMTHRVFSRNAASSRAIPVNKIIDDILADTAMPIHWGKNQKGMQADEECDAPVWIDFGHAAVQASRQEAWIEARNDVILVARAYAAAGYHKQVINRLLEPFMHITTLVSATEWDNFLELRDHEDAEPHIRMLAKEIRACLEDDSAVQILDPGEWHLPFASGDSPFVIGHRIKLSVACCASTSYKTVDGFDMTPERAEAIFDKLVSSRPVHASPCEHVAMADAIKSGASRGKGKRVWDTAGKHGNFDGFVQFRHLLEA